MNKKTLNIVFIIIILILVGIVFWQYKSSRSVEKYVAPLSSSNYDNNVVDTVDKIEDKKTVNTPIETFPKVTAPAKDEDSLKSNFTYEISINKILDKKWVWVEAINYDDSVFVPKKKGVFSLTFKKDGTFGGTTDCNSVFGKYTTRDSKITLSSIGQTEMYCEGFEEVKFTAYLGQVSDFAFNGEENLVLGLEFDSGSIIFK